MELIIKNLSKTYSNGVKALNDVSLDIPKGMYGLLGPNGAGPNVRARNAGFPLPVWYSTAFDANNVESIAAGQPTVQIVWGDFMGSPLHRDHLLGLVDMFRKQTKFGVAYLHAPNAQYVDYWVVVTAEQN